MGAVVLAWLWCTILRASTVPSCTRQYSSARHDVNFRSVGVCRAKEINARRGKARYWKVSCGMEGAFGGGRSQPFQLQAPRMHTYRTVHIVLYFYSTLFALLKKKGVRSRKDLPML